MIDVASHPLAQDARVYITTPRVGEALQGTDTESVALKVALYYRSQLGLALMRRGVQVVDNQQDATLIAAPYVMNVEVQEQSATLTIPEVNGQNVFDHHVHSEQVATLPAYVSLDMDTVFTRNQTQILSVTTIKRHTQFYDAAHPWQSVLVLAEAAASEAAILLTTPQSPSNN